MSVHRSHSYSFVEGTQQHSQNFNSQAVLDLAVRRASELELLASESGEVFREIVGVCDDITKSTSALAIEAPCFEASKIVAETQLLSQQLKLCTLHVKHNQNNLHSPLFALPPFAKEIQHTTQHFATKQNCEQIDAVGVIIRETHECVKATHQAVTTLAEQYRFDLQLSRYERHLQSYRSRLALCKDIMRQHNINPSQYTRGPESSEPVPDAKVQILAGNECSRCEAPSAVSRLVNFVRWVVLWCVRVFPKFVLLHVVGFLRWIVFGWIVEKRVTRRSRRSTKRRSSSSTKQKLVCSPQQQQQSPSPVDD